MVGANDGVGRELVRSMAEYGFDGVERLGQAIHRRSEAHMRQAISRLPSGSYRSEVKLDGYDSEVALKCNVIAKGDSIHVDYTGRSPQVTHPLNLPKH